MSIEINKIYNENCLDTMGRITEDFVDLVITSPPYDELRSYEGKINWNFEIFKIIAKELYRILSRGGVIVWVVGDQTINGSESGTSFRQALYFKEIGFNLHDTMIYQKSGISYPNTVRYGNSFEYMFILSKSKPKTINLLKDKKNRWGGEKTFGIDSKRQKDGSLKRTIKEKKREIQKYGYRENIWKISAGFNCSTKDDIAYKHPAIFPEVLVRDHILTWSNKGDLIYDPFMGSGTTAKMAILTKRNYIGSEIIKKYCDISEKRIRYSKRIEGLFQ